MAYPGRSNHQKGTAVDVTLIDAKTGVPLTMPSNYLEFNKYVGADPGRYPEEAEKNLKILQAAMVEAGMVIYAPEWWHFNNEALESQVDYEDLDPEDYP